MNKFWTWNQNCETEIPAFFKHVKYAGEVSSRFVEGMERIHNFHTHKFNKGDLYYDCESGVGYEYVFNGFDGSNAKELFDYVNTLPPKTAVNFLKMYDITIMVDDSERTDGNWYITYSHYGYWSIGPGANDF